MIKPFFTSDGPVLFHGVHVPHGSLITQRAAEGPWCGRCQEVRGNDHTRCFSCGDLLARCAVPTATPLLEAIQETTLQVFHVGGDFSLVGFVMPAKWPLPPTSNLLALLPTPHPDFVRLGFGAPCLWVVP